MADEVKKEEAVAAPAEETTATEAAAPAAEAAPEAPAAAEAEAAAPAAEEETVEVPAKFKKLVEEIETMTVLELSELVKVLEKKFGVSAAAVAVAGTTRSVGVTGTERSGTTFSSIRFSPAKMSPW